MTSTMITRFGTSTSIAALLASDLKLYLPQNYDGIGDMVADDAGPIADCVAAAEAAGSSIILINKPFRIASGIDLNANRDTLFIFQGDGMLYCDFALADVALNFEGEWDNYASGTPQIINPNILMKSSSTSGLSTGIRIFYDNCTGGGTCGPKIIGGDINRESGGVYFLKGLDLEGAPYAVLSDVSITAKSGLTSTKEGNGIRLGNWAQGTIVEKCNIRGFAAGCYDGDENAADPTEYQAEGVRFTENGFQNCEIGVDVALRDVEVAWSFLDNGFSCNTGIRCRNLSGIQILDNGFQWSNSTKDCVSVLVMRDDGEDPPVATAKGISAMIQNNRTLTGGNLDIDVLNITNGTETIIEYKDSSTSRGISGISVDADGYVTVTYTGADIDMKEGGNITISGATTPTELNGDFRMGDLNTANVTSPYVGNGTFRLYTDNGPIIAANLVDGSAWASLTGTATFIRKFSTGTIVDDDVLFMDRIDGPTELDRIPIIAADVDLNAKTFRALDYQTGLDIDSSAFAALTSRGRLTRFGRHVEIQGGNSAIISDNRVGSRNVNVYLWPMTKNIVVNDNVLAPTGTYAAYDLISNSNYPDTITQFRVDSSDTDLNIKGIGDITHFIRTMSTPGNGVDDDAPYINDLLDAGKTVTLDSEDRKQYLIKSPLIISAAGTGIICPRGKALVTMDMSAGAFDNDVYGDRKSIVNTGGKKYAVGIYATGIENPFVKGLKIRPSVWTDCRYLKPVLIESSTHIETDDNDIRGFSRGRGLITLNSCSQGHILRNILGDTYTLSIFESDGTTAATVNTVQLTGIEIDEARISNVGSDGIEIAGNRIRNITPGAAVLTAYGIQADGINLNGTGGTDTSWSRNCDIHDNRIFNTGEGVDLFGRDCDIHDNYFERCFSAAVKLVHGATSNKVHDNIAVESGAYPFVLGASNSVAVNTKYNEIVRNTVYKVDSPIDWYCADGSKFYDYAASGSVTYWNSTATAGVRINVVAGATSQVEGTVIDKNIIDLNSTGDYGIFIESNANGSATHVVGSNQIRNYGTNAVKDDARYLLIENTKFHLLATGATISTIANFFGGNSNPTLVPGKYYRLLIKMYFLKTTAGTVTFTLTNTAAPTNQVIHAKMSPVTGLVTPSAAAATYLEGDFHNDATAARTIVTGVLTDATNHYVEIEMYIRNSTGTALQIQATCSAGTITPRPESSWELWLQPDANEGVYAS